MKPSTVPGRVPLRVVEHRGEDPRPTLVVHDLGSSPSSVTDLAVRSPERRWRFLHMRGHGRTPRGRGWTYSLHEQASDILRAVEVDSAAPTTVAGFGLSAVPAVLAAVTRPELVTTVALVPGARRWPVSDDPAPRRGTWLQGALRSDEPERPPDVSPVATLDPSEPLLPAERDLLWARLAVPLGVVGYASEGWLEGAEPEAVVGETADPLADLMALLDALGS